jgi:hypothetical protein
MSTGGDVVYDPVLQSNLWIAVASQPIGDATPDAWAAEKLAFDDGCATSEPIAIDGTAGLIGADGCTRAAVTIDGRGYFFWLYTGGDDPSLGVTYDRAWFEEFLATVQLQPEDAIDAPPPLTETFSSERYGISFSYPAGWLTRPATETWTVGFPDFGSTAGDIVHDPVLQDHLWIVVSSRPIGDSTPDEWVAETLTVGECTATEALVVDGANGLIGSEGCDVAAVTTDGRGYFILLYTSSDEPWLAVAYDRAWFEEFLATVQLQPADAVDAAP